MIYKSLSIFPQKAKVSHWSDIYLILSIDVIYEAIKAFTNRHKNCKDGCGGVRVRRKAEEKWKPSGQYRVIKLAKIFSLDDSCTGF